MKKVTRRATDHMRIGGIRIVIPLLRSLFVGAGPLVPVLGSGVRFPVYLRVRTSDFQCYKQVFEKKEYAFEVSRQPRTIVDIGANIGLASIYFANEFPEARIFAVEPDLSNFQLLQNNTAPYRQITPILGAVWNENIELQIVDPGTGKWGFIAQRTDVKNGQPGKMHERVRGLTMPCLLQEVGIDQVDILKVDIEGSEKELFGGRLDWINRVDAIIIETHDWLKPGCSQSVADATSDFDHRWQLGENQFIVRRRGCIARQ